MRISVNRSLLIALMATVALCGCGRKDGGKDMCERTGYAHADDQLRFKEALTESKIAFQTERSGDGVEMLRYSTRDKREVAAIQERLFGVPPPNGRNVTHDLRVRLEAELQKRSVPYRLGSYHGSEYLAWEPEQDDAVDAVLRTFSAHPEFLAGFQRNRAAVDLSKTDLTLCRVPGRNLVPFPPKTSQPATVDSYQSPLQKKTYEATALS